MEPKHVHRACTGKGTQKPRQMNRRLPFGWIYTFASDQGFIVLNRADEVIQHAATYAEGCAWAERNRELIDEPLTRPEYLNMDRQSYAAYLRDKRERDGGPKGGVFNPDMKQPRLFDTETTQAIPQPELFTALK